MFQAAPLCKGDKMTIAVELKTDSWVKYLVLGLFQKTEIDTSSLQVYKR